MPSVLWESQKVRWSRLSDLKKKKEGKKSFAAESTSKKSFLKDEAKHNSILWIFYLISFRCSRESTFQVFSSSFPFNVRNLWIHGCGRCRHFSHSVLPEMSLLLWDVYFQKKKKKKDRSVYLINKPVTRFCKTGNENLWTRSIRAVVGLINLQSQNGVCGLFLKGRFWWVDLSHEVRSPASNKE